MENQQKPFNAREFVRKAFSSDNKFDKDAYLQQRVDAFNQAKGDLKGYDCPLCLNKGVTMELDKAAGTVHTYVCECAKIRTYIQHMENSGLGAQMKQQTFESFHVTAPWQEACLNFVKAFADKPDGWLYLSGQSGCGKTHLCTALCSHLVMHGKKVLYFSWAQEGETLKNFREPERQRTLREKLQGAEVLYIDDFLKTPIGTSGQQKPSAQDLQEAVSLIGSRYSAGKITIISSELNLDTVLALDESLGGRIHEKARDHILNIHHAPDRNYRLAGSPR